MDEDVIDDLAAAFFSQMSLARDTDSIDSNYMYALVDCIVLTAIVINTHMPTYDLRYFYRNSGLPEPWPQHDMTP